MMENIKMDYLFYVIEEYASVSNGQKQDVKITVYKNRKKNYNLRVGFANHAFHSKWINQVTQKELEEIFFCFHMKYSTSMMQEGGYYIWKNNSAFPFTVHLIVPIVYLPTTMNAHVNGVLQRNERYEFQEKRNSIVEKFWFYHSKISHQDYLDMFHFFKSNCAIDSVEYAYSFSYATYLELVEEPPSLRKHFSSSISRYVQ